MSTAKFNQWLNSDGTENYKCRAWVNFNGTGTVAIRASGNVSSITDNGTGDYTVNFTTAMPDANFSAAGTAANDQSGGTFVGLNDGRRTVTTLRVTTKGVTESLFDCPIVNVAIFR